MSNELITINYNEQQEPYVMGRDLHEKLEIQTDYMDWFQRMRAFDFIEGKDFSSILRKNGERGRPSYDHKLTIDMAKEICMLQRTELGKKYREYFLELEKEWNSPEAVMARALKMSEMVIERLKTQNCALVEANKSLIKVCEVNKPKVNFANSIEETDDELLIREVAKILKQNGLEMGEKRLYKELRKDGLILKHSREPSQYAMEHGWFRVHEQPVNPPNSEPFIVRRTKVTAAGQTYIVDKYLRKYSDEIDLSF